MAEHVGRSGSTDVTVIGCGLMGSALARQFAKSGYRVSAWNRTPERAQALAPDGVTPIRSIVDAVRSSPLVVTCTLDYESTRSAVDPVGSWDGITLVNLATGTPDEAEEFERWAGERGAQYLEGSIFGFPKDIGSAEGMIFYSGPPGVWSEHEETLMALGGASRHVAEDVRTANVLILGFGAFYLPALGAFVEAATYAVSERVAPGLLVEITVRTLEILASALEEAATAITSGQHETDQATLEAYAVGGRSFLGAMREAGQHARLLAATVENLDAAEAAGLGKLGFYAQAKVARREQST